MKTGETVKRWDLPGLPSNHSLPADVPSAAAQVMTDPTDLSIEGISIGNDRMARLEVGLLEGTYELVLITVGAPTHYHMNVSYGSDEFLLQQPNGQPFSAARQAEDLRLEEILAPYVRRLASAQQGAP